MIEFATICIFAVLQSIFGIGILFFGTPTLLLLGFPFSETLSILLPASLGVSAFQVAGIGTPNRTQIQMYVTWCLVPLAIALISGLLFNLDVELELIVALTLLLYIGVRLSPRMEIVLREQLQRTPQAWLVGVGAVHGLSNLGGGLLAIFAGSRFENKQDVRGNIAFCYMCFAIIQLAILAFLKPDVMHVLQLAYALVAIIIFIVVDKLVFSILAKSVFDKILTIVIGCYSALIFLKLFGFLDPPTNF